MYYTQHEGGGSVAQAQHKDPDQVAVIGVERGRHGCKAALLVGGQLHEYWAPSVAAAPSATAEDEGDPLEKLILDGRTWLVGNRALAQSGDGLFRIVGDKTATDSDSGAEFKASIAAVLAWASSVVDLENTPLHILTSAPDSEWSRTKDPLKAALIGRWDFAVGAERGWPNGQTRRNLYLTVADARVAKESVVPLYAHIFDAEGYEVAGNPFTDARTLCIGVGFRDWNVAATEGGAILRSKSGRRGVAEIYVALWDPLYDIYPALSKLADVDDIMQGYRDPTRRSHPVWSHRDPEKVAQAIDAVVMEKGASILDEALQFAGDPETYHRVLVSGGGCLLLQDLVRQRFGSGVSFAAVGDGARGLAYRGARWVRTGK